MTTYYHVFTTTHTHLGATYQHIKTYRRWGMLKRYLMKHPDPVWVWQSRNEGITLQRTDNDFYFGGYENTLIWNASGFGRGYMPRLRITALTDENRTTINL